MTDTATQDLIARLRGGHHLAEITILGGVAHDTRCLEAAELIFAGPDIHHCAIDQALEILRLRAALMEIHDCVDISEADAVARAALAVKP